MKFKNYLQLDEVLLTFGRKRPRFNQVIVLAGGAGSGKGFVIDNLLGVDAKVMDVDQIKGKIIHPGTPKLNKKIMDKYGIDVTKMDLRKPAEVAKLHQINDEMGISKKVQDLFFKDLERLSKKEMLPNVVFDSTAKSEKKIKEIIDTTSAAGYKEENMHLVWVINDVEIAKAQNLQRDRVVPEDILVQTHELVAANISSLLKNNKLDKYFGGDIYFVFNKKYVDSAVGATKSGGFYVKEALIVKVKEKGKRSKSYGEISDEFIKKIRKYIPKNVKDLWN